jgi:hypothetical protein
MARKGGKQEKEEDTTSEEDNDITYEEWVAMSSWGKKKKKGKGERDPAWTPGGNKRTRETVPHGRNLRPRASSKPTPPPYDGPVAAPRSPEVIAISSDEEEEEEEEQDEEELQQEYDNAQVMPQEAVEKLAGMKAAVLANDTGEFRSIADGASGWVIRNYDACPEMIRSATSPEMLEAILQIFDINDDDFVTVIMESGTHGGTTPQLRPQMLRVYLLNSPTVAEDNFYANDDISRILRGRYGTDADLLECVRILAPFVRDLSYISEKGPRTFARDAGEGVSSHPNDANWILSLAEMLLVLEVQPSDCRWVLRENMVRLMRRRESMRQNRDAQLAVVASIRAAERDQGLVGRTDPNALVVRRPHSPGPAHRFTRDPLYVRDLLRALLQLMQYKEGEETQDPRAHRQ